MFTWPEIILALLKLVNTIMGAVEQDKWMKAGADAEIAKISASILRKTTAGKAIMEKVDAMSDADVDAELRRLGSE
jgi:uncharacterized membrane protein